MLPDGRTIAGEVERAYHLRRRRHHRNHHQPDRLGRAAAAWLAENLPDLNVAAPYVTAGEVLLAL